ncbi:hypothetical protein [Kutzneria kofuensis]|uniref:Uncharacterized protein n=1 Tax=Kutzneria kofuensis TaxID=103725 RepID=A0A7W9KC50_9PSEU|nr:hypothetical protein [Kutzneria kofuensis]MBB5889890.1 hypothetical protein [Kutzneria kofuensis]
MAAAEQDPRETSSYGGNLRISPRNNETIIVVASQADIRPCNLDQAGEAALAEYYELAVASAKIDRPHEPATSYEAVIGRLRRPSSDADTVRHWFAYQAGTVIGHMTVMHVDRASAPTSCARFSRCCAPRGGPPSRDGGSREAVSASGGPSRAAFN